MLLSVFPAAVSFLKNSFLKIRARLGPSLQVVSMSQVFLRGYSSLLKKREKKNTKRKHLVTVGGSHQKDVVLSLIHISEPTRQAS